MGLASAERAGAFIRPPPEAVPALADCSRDGMQGLLNIAGHPCVAYDPSGTVFAVALNLRSTIMMYDVKQFDKQPFLCVHIDDPVLPLRAFPPRTPVMTSLSFSNDGKWLLVGTSGDVHYVLDSFDGGVLARLESKPACPPFLKAILISGEDAPKADPAEFFLYSASGTDRDWAGARNRATLRAPDGTRRRTVF